MGRAGLGWAVLELRWVARGWAGDGLDWAFVDITTHVPLPGITMRATLKPMIGASAAGLRWAGLGWAGLGVHWAGLR